MKHPWIGRLGLGALLVGGAVGWAIWLGRSSGVQEQLTPEGSRSGIPRVGDRTDLRSGLPGMPRYQPDNVYAFARAGALSSAVEGVPERVYVPDGKSNILTVIDPKTFEVLGRYRVGRVPQHVVPAYDLKTLYVTNDVGGTITPIDPKTGVPGLPIRVTAPYNLYFTPDGHDAIVVAETKRRLDFYDPHTWTLRSSLRVPCRGINHMDFSSDGRFIVAACEFSGDLIRIDLQARAVIAQLHVGGMPQDVRLAPDGRVFYVADMMAGGLHVISSDRLERLGFIPTGKGAHGLYPSRDATKLYISNRGEGTISVLEFATHTLEPKKWVIPGGGSPDMGGVSADGTQLWLGGRYHGEVYVFDTIKGELVKRIKVGPGPHGLAIFPQPGRYSLGHTGNYR